MLLAGARAALPGFVGNALAEVRACAESGAGIRPLSPQWRFVDRGAGRGSAFSSSRCSPSPPGIRSDRHGGGRLREAMILKHGLDAPRTLVFSPRIL
jgi:hypothetical protein